ncbi:hypothetical protein BT96DRAFT_996045 [Gymnopus androsaceus JB14]|uniref:WD40 repeat-like protein n=1 Tax=Gymnopus androsaceus JB14 TaxID=1447944 RepID=A0A6A4HFH2_9AGAR|nr:hypothetical protein BT96DRAFT_996045 [Gymnopus androsaceus JB14]
MPLCPILLLEIPLPLLPEQEQEQAQAPITCFQHKEWKVVSGSDGTLKVWDLRDINVSASFPGGPGLGAANANAAFGGGGGGV